MYWLDDGRFRRLYERDTSVKVWKTDELPEKSRLMALPQELENALLATRAGPLLKHNAFQVAMSPYGKASKMMINAVNDVLLNARQTLQWELEEVRPFLLAIQHYEKRLQNRHEVLRDVEKRLSEIVQKTTIQAQSAM